MIDVPYTWANSSSPEKIQTGGGGLWGHGYFFKKGLWNFKFATLLLEIPDKKQDFHPWKFHKIVLHPLEYLSQGQTPRPMQILHDFFLIENITSFFIDPWNFHILFFTTCTPW